MLHSATVRKLDGFDASKTKSLLVGGSVSTRDTVVPPPEVSPMTDRVLEETGNSKEYS